MTELEQICAAALARDADQPAIGFQGRWYSWDDVRRVADRLSALMAASGACAQAPVAFAPRNRPAALAVLLGLMAQGRSIRIVYPFQSTAGMMRDLALLQPEVVVIDRQDDAEELRAAMQAQGCAVIVLEEMDVQVLPGLAQCREVGSEHELQRQIEILTSGTTGAPKRFTIGYDMIAEHLVAKNPSAARDDLVSAPPALLYFPLGNISGLYTTLPALLLGQRTILLERFSIEAWHAYVKEYRPQAGGMPPAGVHMVLEAAVPPEDLASLKFLGTGAAPLELSVQREFEQRYGIPVLLSYGATEFGGPVAAMTPQLHAEWGAAKFGSVGRAMPGVKLRVINPDSGEECAPGQEGLLEVVSPRIGPDWIRTSDIAVIDEDAFLFHLGRADGAISRGGFKLLPEVIEKALLRHPAVARASVVGIADPRLGQVPAAAIELKAEANAPDINELEAHLREHVYATHIPTRWRFVDALPRTPLMKIDRRAVRALFE